MKTRTERKTEDIDIITNDSIKIRDHTQQGIVNDAVRIDNYIDKNQDIPTGWRGIKRVPFARWDDFIENMEDDPRVQEHVKKLEVILTETMKEYILPPDPNTLNKYIVAITNEDSHSPEIFIGTGETAEEARKAAKDKRRD